MPSKWLLSALLFCLAFSVDAVDNTLNRIVTPACSEFLRSIHFESLRNRNILIGGPESSGSLISHKLAAMGFSRDQLYYFHSAPVPPIYTASFHPENFARGFEMHHGPDPVLIDDMRAHNFAAVFSGAEHETVASEFLAQQFGLRSNFQADEAWTADAQYSRRRIKDWMTREVGSVGLRVPKQIATSDLNQLIALKNEHIGPDYPVVIKPENGLGASFVFFPSSDEMLVKNFQEGFGRVNSAGSKIERLVVQEKLQGTEYFIEVLAAHGEYRLAYIAEYEKKPIDGDASKEYFSGSHLLPMGHEFEAEATRYAFKAAKALKHFEGALHMEVIRDPIKGIGFVEAGSRMAGLRFPLLVEIATGFSELEQVPLANLAPEIFLNQATNENGALMRSRDNSFSFILIHNRRAGAKLNVDKMRKVFRGEINLDHEGEFQTVQINEIVMKYKDGEAMKKTVDLETIALFIPLIGPDEIVSREYKRLRNLEALDFFSED